MEIYGDPAYAKPERHRNRRRGQNAYIRTGKSRTDKIISSVRNRGKKCPKQILLCAYFFLYTANYFSLIQKNNTTMILILHFLFKLLMFNPNCCVVFISSILMCCFILFTDWFKMLSKSAFLLLLVVTYTQLARCQIKSNCQLRSKY